MKLGTVLSGGTDVKGKPEEEDAANIPWFDLAEDQLLSDNDWWTRQQAIYQQMKKEEPEFFDVLRRSAKGTSQPSKLPLKKKAGWLSNRQLLTPKVKASLSGLYGESADDVAEAVSFLRAFGRARKLTGSDSPIFTMLEGLTPKKASAQVITALERLLVSVPRESQPKGWIL